MKKRDWTVLLVGGSSGIGKTQLTKELSNIYNIKMIEADDICCAVKSMTSSDAYPAIHYWYGDDDWEELSIDENIEKLCKVTEELRLGLKAIIDNHINKDSPIIIEGDFISPEFVSSFDKSKVKSIYLYEPSKTQIINNYLSREGGEAQEFRAGISFGYGENLKKECYKYGVSIVKSRPWNTLVSRVIDEIDK